MPERKDTRKESSDPAGRRKARSRRDRPGPDAGPRGNDALEIPADHPLDSPEQFMEGGRFDAREDPGVARLEKLPPEQKQAIKALELGVRDAGREFKHPGAPRPPADEETPRDRDPGK